MYNPDPERGPSSVSEWLFVAIACAVILGLFGMDVYQNYTPVKLSVLLFVLFWVPLLVLHESGYAIVAFLFGWHVGQIVIGVGKTLGEFRIGRSSVEVRILPLEGFVCCVPARLTPRIGGNARNSTAATMLAM